MVGSLTPLSLQVYYITEKHKFKVYNKVMGIFSKIFGPKKPDPRPQQEIDEQIVIIENITRGQ